MKRNSSLLHIRVHNFFLHQFAESSILGNVVLPLDLLYCSIVLINNCLIKNRSKLSSVLQLCLLQIFIRQMLPFIFFFLFYERTENCLLKIMTSLESYCLILSRNPKFRWRVSHFFSNDYLVSCRLKGFSFFFSCLIFDLCTIIEIEKKRLTCSQPRAVIMTIALLYCY